MKKVKGLRDTRENNHRDEKHSTGNIGNNIEIIMDGARILEISGEHFMKDYMII